jgi:hypothetical protein
MKANPSINFLGPTGPKDLRKGGLRILILSSKKMYGFGSSSKKLMADLKTKKTHAFASGFIDTTIKVFIHTICYLVDFRYTA